MTSFMQTMPDDAEMIDALSNEIARLTAEYQTELSDGASGALATLRGKLTEAMNTIVRVPTAARLGAMGTICGEWAPEDASDRDAYYKLLARAVESCGRFTPGEFMQWQESYGHRAGHLGGHY